MPLNGLVSPGPVNIVVAPGLPDDADRPAGSDVLEVAYAKSGFSYLNTTEVTEPYAGDLPRVLALAAGATLIVALFASLMITGLALAEGRADFATLAAVGAQPATRRRIAAATAAFVTVVGGIVGAVSGLIIARLLNSLVVSDYPNIFVVPWLMLAVTLIGIPALTGALAWLFTRSRVVMVRRVD